MPAVSTRNGQSKQAVAKYDARCCRCGNTIPRGAVIEKIRTPDGYDRWVHDDCQWAVAAGETSPSASHSTIDRADLEALVQRLLDKHAGSGGSSDTATIRQEVVTQVSSKMEKAEAVLLDLVNDAIQKQRAADQRKLDAKLAEMDKLRRVELVVKRPDGEVTIAERTHPAFQDVIFHLNCGDNVMLVGPTGCGKTFLAAQIARAMGLDFRFLSCSVGVTESSILGQREPNDAGGFEYRTSAFVDAYENGKLFLWDEVDALDPNVFLSVNAALANGHMSVPKRFGKTIADRHEKFVCLCAANTYGNGADRRYVGRNQLDGASVDRFVFIAMDYDPDVELSLCPDAELLNRLWGYRRRMREARLERNLSTRFIKAAYGWVKNGKDYGYVDGKLLAGWREDEIRKVKGA